MTEKRTCGCNAELMLFLIAEENFDSVVVNSLSKLFDRFITCCRHYFEHLPVTTKTNNVQNMSTHMRKQLSYEVLT